MQAMGIEQRQSQTRPVRGDFAAQRLDHPATVIGFTQLGSAAADQHITQSLQGLTVRLTLAGEAKQPFQHLSAKLQGLRRGDKCQTGAQYALFTVQPPQPFTQGQRLAAR